MAEPIALIAGLGNPGPEYANTRHNAGFWFLDALARAYGAALRPESRFHGEAGRATIAGQSVWLLKPSTFMNRSGQSVAGLAHFYKIAPTAILIVHDELDFAPGIARFKEGGGHGGHNGLKDIHAQLGSPGYVRLRLGIGRPADASQQVGFVLGKPPASERALIDEAISAALLEVPKLVTGDLAKATMSLHGRGKA